MKRLPYTRPTHGSAQPANEAETTAEQQPARNPTRRHLTRLLLLGAPVAAVLAAAGTETAEAGESNSNAAAAATDSWKLGGNTLAKTDGSLFVGSNDNTPLVLKTNKTERMRIREDGLVGIGTSPGSAQLAVGSGTRSAIRGETTAAGGIGVFGIADFPNTTAGVFGAHLGGGTGILASSDTSIGGGALGIGLKATSTGAEGFGVRAEATATSGKATGVSGTTSSPTGRGVSGLNLATSGEAPGVLRSSNSPNGRGVVGLVVAPGGSSIAVLGQAASAGGTAVFADATSATGFTKGIHARVASPDGVGLKVEATATSGGADGARITTKAIDGTGLYVSSPGVALFAEQTRVDAFAAYFKGDIYVEGTGSIGSSVRKIDHPLDPENKYLSQAFVASPEMLSVYNGNAVTDARRLATVKLPAYVEALNRDFRYQLTVIGQFAQAIVARKVADNQFTIQTDKPNVEVSWQLTGIQQDAFAEVHRVAPELDKPNDERGLLLHPREHGFGEDRALSRTRSRQGQADK